MIQLRGGTEDRLPDAKITIMPQISQGDESMNTKESLQCSVGAPTNAIGRDVAAEGHGANTAAVRRGGAFVLAADVTAQISDQATDAATSNPALTAVLVVVALAFVAGTIWGLIKGAIKLAVVLGIIAAVIWFFILGP